MQVPFGPYAPSIWNVVKTIVAYGKGVCYDLLMAYNLAGQRFGKLTVIDLAPPRGKHRRWNCICDCGGICTPSVTNLRSGNSTACGNCRVGSVSNLSHGDTANGKINPTYKTWLAMRYRVKSKPGYAHVSIDPRWVSSYAAFKDDMGERPHGTSLDRIDNKKGYDKENCRWATPVQQTRNRRITRFFTVNGVTRAIGDWAEMAGISYGAAVYRLETYGTTELPHAG